MADMKMQKNVLGFSFYYLYSFFLFFCDVAEQ